MRKNLITDFSRGEISPLLEGRFDLEFYKQSNSFSENTIPLSPSGFSIRPGTYHKGETSEASDSTILIPKIHKVSGGFVIEMGDNYARVWEDGVLKNTSASTTPEGIVTGIVLSATVPDNGTLQEDLTHANRYTENLAVVAGDQTLDISFDGIGASSSEYNLDLVIVTVLRIGTGTTNYEIPAGDPFLLELTGLVNDSYTVSLASKVIPSVPRKIYTGIPEASLSGMTWVQEDESIHFASKDFSPRGIDFKENQNPSAWGISGIFFNSEQWEKYEQVFLDEIRQYSDGVYFTCIKTLQGTALVNIPSAEPTYWQDEGLTRPDGLRPFDTDAIPGVSQTNTWPAVVTLHQGRRVYANTAYETNALWGSKANDSDIYALGPHDDSPWSHAIDLSEGSAIHWMQSTDSGIIGGSLSSEWKVQGGEIGITPATINIQRLTSFGSSPVGSMLMGSQIFFFGNSGEELYNYFFQERNSAYKSIQVSEIAEHMLADDYYTDFQEVTQYGGGGVKSFSFQNDPQKIFWMIKNSGQLIGMNISNAGVAWHKHTTKQGQFQSIATIPGTTYDEVYLIVKREINSATKYFFEKMADLNIHQDVDDYHLVDCGIAIQADQAPDLTHLNGEEVAVSILGKHTAVKTVAANTIDILEDYPSVAVATSSLFHLNSATAHIGLFTEARSRSMRQGFPTTSISMGPVTLRLYKSFGGSIGEGVKPESLQPLDYPPAPENNDLSSPYETLDIDNNEGSVVAYKNLFSGERRIDFMGDWNSSGYVWIVQDKPVPFVVLGMYADMEDGE